MDKKTYTIKKHDIDIKKASKKMKSKKVDATLHDVPASQFPVYFMICPAGEYEATSWISLGWQILKHRVYHLMYDGKWMD